MQYKTALALAPCGAGAFFLKMVQNALDIFHKINILY